MNAKEIRGKDDEEIRFDLGQLRKELFDMKFRSVVEANADPAKIRRHRRDIARMRTVLRERELHSGAAR
ncbi:MAG: 50S ribosomal protein L29 [Planctomycetota bacterium]|nr:MAG: 50S ribosomal protein L29 [Planctomycetota bacterium]